MVPIWAPSGAGTQYYRLFTHSAPRCHATTSVSAYTHRACIFEPLLNSHQECLCVCLAGHASERRQTKDGSHEQHQCRRNAGDGASCTARGLQQSRRRRSRDGGRWAARTGARRPDDANASTSLPLSSWPPSTGRAPSVAALSAAREPMRTHRTPGLPLWRPTLRRTMPPAGRGSLRAAWARASGRGLPNQSKPCPCKQGSRYGKPPLQTIPWPSHVRLLWGHFSGFPERIS